ncbi:succinate-semialdehyde dehydrogenase [Tersicoccus solisilvae]|uniref:Succinate-semialdehyde dehydrogenase n=1 Tax=Tersicoccus solisilvae TaxID=1882339 RepID=A0ABQ1NR87_9MICC|nr:zinc-binding dehydrogenase [Tersicoccus solisilvae]GGC81783.1 succinate-semialdehyde dehydrogenase [Tersicoccus solisilvae]
MRAHVLDTVGTDLREADVVLGPPKPGEVGVRVAACGVCHTDLHVIKGEVAFPTPCVLGHEISGWVEAIGEGVTGLDVGDRVVCSFIMPCGSCRQCDRGHEDLCETFFAKNRLKGQLYDGSSRLSAADGTPIAMYSMAGLAEHAVVPATAVFRLPDAIPLEQAAVLGCSVFTSYGAVHNVGKVTAGDTVAVVAAGGIGLNIVQMAVAHGASRVIAIDIDDEKLALARRVGATDTVNSRTEDPLEAVRRLTDGHGVDVAFEAFGSAPTVRTAVDVVDDGGRVVLVGIAPVGVEAQFDIARVVRRKIQILGSFGARASVDMPAVLDLVADGRIRLDDLVTDRYAFADAGRAYRDLEERRIRGRAVVTLTG